jgi:hypothetical protein
LKVRKALDNKPQLKGRLTPEIALAQRRGKAAALALLF